MKILAIVIDCDANVTRHHLIGTKEDVLKQLLCVQYCGEVVCEVVDDLYKNNSLRAMTALDVAIWIKNHAADVVEEDEDDIVEVSENDKEEDVEDLLTEMARMTDDVDEFFNQLFELFDGEVGLDFTEVAEMQTTILVKLA